MSARWWALPLALAGVACTRTPTPPAAAPTPPLARSLWAGGSLVRDLLGIDHAVAPLAPGSTTPTWHWEHAGTQPLDLAFRLSVAPGHGGALRFQLAVDGATVMDETVGAEGRRVQVPLPAGSAAAPVKITLTAQPGVIVGGPVLYRPEAAPSRVVVVVVDTLRADHLGAWGYPRPTSPALDALAAAGRRWERCTAPSPWTLPSTRVALTGRPHAEHAASSTLTTRFAQAGWATAAITRNPWLAAGMGVADGGALHDGRHRVDAALATTEALRWLHDEADRSAFLLLHHMDPHLPYRPHPSTPAELTEAPQPQAGLTTSQLAQVAAYDGEIRYTDAAIGALWEGMQELPGRSLLIVTADHGEEFWEHGGAEHGHSLHPELLDVPLLAVGDGVPAGTVVSAPVSLLDLAPTVAAWAGLPPDPASPGRDLLAPGPLPPAAPLFLGETISTGEAIGVATAEGRYWLQHGQEHQTDPATGAPPTAAQAAARLPGLQAALGTLGWQVVDGATLVVPRSARAVHPGLGGLEVAWGAPVAAARLQRGDGYALPAGATLTVHGGDRTTLLLPQGSAGLAVRLDGPLPDAVQISEPGQPAAAVGLTGDRQRRVNLTGGPLPLRLAAGRIAWPGEGAVLPVDAALPDGGLQQLQALGYVSGP